MLFEKLTLPVESRKLPLLWHFEKLRLQLSEITIK